jgi:hypothetical protein
MAFGLPILGRKQTSVGMHLEGGYLWASNNQALQIMKDRQAQGMHAPM